MTVFVARGLRRTVVSDELMRVTAVRQKFERRPHLETLPVSDRLGAQRRRARG